MKKYLKSYTEIVSGSMAGRDDGYPYTAYSVYENIEDVARYHGSKRDEQYFKIKAVNEAEFLKAIEQAKKVIEENKRLEERAKKELEIKRLQAELEEVK